MASYSRFLKQFLCKAKKCVKPIGTEELPLAVFFSQEFDKIKRFCYLTAKNVFIQYNKNGKFNK
jgi:hypothetical protein